MEDPYSALYASKPRVIIWCSVIDNFGDAGVCLRLANTICKHQAQPVWLCIDNPQTLAKILPHLNPHLIAQAVNAQLYVIHWSNQWECALQEKPLHRLIAETPFVSTFACKPPLALRQYRAKLQQSNSTNLQDYHLEYLTMAKWATDLQRMTQTDAPTGYQSTLLVPGFVHGSAGLLAPAIDTTEPYWWQTIIDGSNMNILLFTYHAGQDFIMQLLNQCEHMTGHNIQLWLAPGYCQQLIKEWLAQTPHYQRSHIRIICLPWLAQHAFDALIQQVDLAIVRGEDSATVANICSKRFLWQLYKEDGGGEQQKLDYYLALHPWSETIKACFRWLNDIAIPNKTDSADLMRRFLLGASDCQHDYQQWHLYLKGLPNPANAVLYSLASATAKHHSN